ncbi:MAG: DUF4331 family protein [Planctomycetes bacterium]|nr:DUF4331 family protein [Planctomycetota bacterium]
MQRSLRTLGIVAALVTSAGWIAVQASDHDDGELELKGRNLNLTDLYAFREGDQTGVTADNANLILIMDTNPRSVARQQYFFSTTARYEFHVTRVTANTDTPTGADDVILRFEFGTPDTNKRQPVIVTALLDGQVLQSAVRKGTSNPIQTTELGGAIIENTVTLGTRDLTIFAGLREDPFFFDVEQFFKVRGGAAGAFRTAATAVDFTAGYNVNAIVARVPIAFLQGSTTLTRFDVWETVSVPN